MNKRVGKQSVKFENKIFIVETACTAGPKEGEGPLAFYFDNILKDVLAGQESWELAESEIVKATTELLIRKSGVRKEDIQYILGGDLLNQCIGTTFGIIGFDIPFLGIFGACSTYGEGMAIGAMMIDGGFAENIIAGASSHFCSAEKQFRFPLALGNQRPPTASWTVTGGGEALLSKTGNGPHITGATIGKVVDMGIKDPNNMGAAMAPSAADTLVNHFRDFNITPDYYDVIATGDLGHYGHEIVVKLMANEGYKMGSSYTDCGMLVFDKEKQDTHAGGSGCGCSAITFSGYFYRKLKEKEINKMLFIPTGALLSPTSSQQGNNIPGVAHAVVIEA